MNKQREPVIRNTDESQLFGIIAAFVAVLVTLAIFLIWRRRKSVGKNILLTGLSDAGKTVLYTKLFSSKSIRTHTSVKENVGNIVINDKTLQIVDIPGHERLRYKFFDKYKNSARGLIYVIDSVTLSKDIRDAAEFLYTLLSDEVMQKDISVLILCNKQDQTMAKGCGIVQTLLEKEINLLRLTKMNQLEATDSTSANSFVGKQGKDFEFSHLVNKVDFAEGSVSDIDQVKLWLEKVV
ncbi:signal recognition particle receptor subunit beta [Venturia canescens]|uniref:signal recognition particle receptor subunit beta n=1 Tax=Venturia canescens TaxID=32260 RepID=UPI001C9C2EE8|nr:signal recognition particle receptor subunit beta [Venturia canescens]